MKLFTRAEMANAHPETIEKAQAIFDDLNDWARHTPGAGFVGAVNVLMSVLLNLAALSPDREEASRVCENAAKQTSELLATLRAKPTHRARGLRH